jgi:hypothetical protein
MLDFHSFEETGNLRHQFKVIFEQICFKHSIEIFRNFFSFMEAALKVVSYLSDVRNINVLIAFIIVFREIKVDFLCEEKFQEKVH